MLGIYIHTHICRNWYKRNRKPNKNCEMKQIVAEALRYTMNECGISFNSSSSFSSSLLFCFALFESASDRLRLLLSMLPILSC